MADLGGVLTSPRRGDKASRKLIIWSMVVGIVLSGLGFAYKVAEFMFTMSAPEFAGSFDVPVIVYFAVAGGWFVLLVWCFTTGKFQEMERGKTDLLAQEEEYERNGI